MPTPPYPTTPLSAQQFHDQQLTHLARQQQPPSPSVCTPNETAVLGFGASSQQQQQQQLQLSQTHTYEVAFTVLENMGTFMHELYDLMVSRPQVQFENPERGVVRGKRRQIFFRRVRRRYGIPLAPIRPPGENSFSSILSSFFSIASSFSLSKPTLNELGVTTAPPKEKVGELEKELETLRSQIALLMQSNGIANNLHPHTPGTPIPFSPNSSSLLPQLSSSSSSSSSFSSSTPSSSSSPSSAPPPPPPLPPLTPLQKPVVVLKRRPARPRSPLSPLPSSSSSSKSNKGVSLDDILQSRTTLRRVKGSPRKNSKARTKQRDDARMGVLSKALTEKFKNTSSPTKEKKRTPSSDNLDSQWVDDEKTQKNNISQENTPLNRTASTPLLA